MTNQLSTGLLRDVGVPREFASMRIARSARWLTWNARFLSGLLRHAEALRRTPLRRTLIPEQQPYPRSWNLDIGKLPLAAAFREAAESLHHLRLGREVAFLTGMLDRLDTDLLKRAIAGLRAALVSQSEDGELAALHAAVHRSARGVGFALHADIFLPRRLMLVFDDVSSEGSQSLFLSRAQFQNALREARVPQRVNARLTRLLRGDRRVDGFTEFFDLCHGDHPWVERLAPQLARRERMISLIRGQGYLFDDREWLHGRGKGTAPIRQHRFHRLVF